MSIRTVQTDFTSSSWSPLHPISMNAQIPSHRYNPQQQYEKYPPGLGYSLPAAAESTPVLLSSLPRTTRRRSGGFTFPSGQSYNHSRRRPPPPPSVHAPIKFDPFACDESTTAEPVYNHYWQYNSNTKSAMLVYKTDSSHKPNTVHISPSTPYTIKLPNVSTLSLPATTTKATRAPPPPPPPQPKTDRNARAKLVAGILLNRIYAVGKPMRRRLSTIGADKAYVKSGLSSVVSVEC